MEREGLRCCEGGQGLGATMRVGERVEAEVDLRTALRAVLRSRQIIPQPLCTPLAPLVASTRTRRRPSEAARFG
jgi:hypothetical protein